MTKGDYLSWDLRTWNNNIKQILKSKLDKGYEGCGSQRGYEGAISGLSSPVISSGSPSFPGAQAMSSNSRLASSSLSQVQQAHHHHQQQQEQQAPTNPQTEPELKPANSGLNKNINDSSIGIPHESKSTLLDVDKSSENHKSVQFAEIYQKYSDIQTPSDQFDRNATLNGSHERISSDNLPHSFGELNLKSSIYPKDDIGLISDYEEDEEEDDDEEDSRYEKIDVRKIGINPEEAPSTPTVGSLAVPYPDERSGSHSSVMSPMAQFSAFQETYKQQTVKRNPYPNNSDDDDVGSPPLPVPAHDAKYQPGFQGNINSVSLGITGARGSTGKA